MENFANFVGGRFVAPLDGAYLETDDPFTGASWATIPRSNARDVDAAVSAAKRAFDNDWAAVSAVERGQLLRKFASIILENQEELAVIESRDNGKTLAETRKQVANSAEWYVYYAGLADKIDGQVVPVERPEMFNYTRLEPLGVVALITPWNSPLRLLSWKLAPALAAGNTVVIKPSEFTSASTLHLMRYVEQAGFPAGVVNVVTGLGIEVGAAIAAHPDVAKISFTGGEEGGLAVYQSAARTLKHVALELGGKSPNIVFDDANIENAARGAVSAIFASCGQSCVAGSRLLVQRNVASQIVDRVVELASSIRLGDPAHPDTEMGPIANRPQYERILSYVEIGKKEGAKLRAGGVPALQDEGGRGLFIRPTVFDEVHPQMRIAREEIFGPVLSVLRFDTEEDAIRIANDSNYGLAAGIWTENLGRAHRVAARLQAGSVWVNTYRVTSQLSPFGGYKRSGIGREGGSAMIRDFLQTKSVWINTGPSSAYPFKVPA